MSVNISTYKNDLRDSVHLAMVMARKMVLAMCVCGPLSSNHMVWECFSFECNIEFRYVCSRSIAAQPRPYLRRLEVAKTSC